MDCSPQPIEMKGNERKMKYLLDQDEYDRYEEICKALEAIAYYYPRAIDPEEGIVYDEQSKARAFDEVRKIAKKIINP